MTLCDRCGGDVVEEIEGFDLRKIRGSLDFLNSVFHDSVTRGGRITESEAEDALAEITDIEEALQ